MGHNSKALIVTAIAGFLVIPEWAPALIFLIVVSLIATYMGRRHEPGYKEEEKAMKAQKDLAPTIGEQTQADVKLINRENYDAALQRREEIEDLNEKAMIDGNAHLIDDIISNNSTSSFYNLGRNISELIRRIGQEDAKIEQLLIHLEEKERRFVAHEAKQEDQVIIEAILAFHNIEKDRTKLGQAIRKEEKLELKHLKRSIDLTREIRGLEKQRLSFERKKRDLTKKILSLLNAQYGKINAMVNKRKLNPKEMNKIRKENTELLSKLVEKIDIEQKIIYIDGQMKNLLVENRKIDNLVLNDIRTLEREIQEREKQPQQLELFKKAA